MFSAEAKVEICVPNSDRGWDKVQISGSRGVIEFKPVAKKPNKFTREYVKSILHGEYVCRIRYEGINNDYI